MTDNKIITRIKDSSLFKDSFWAVFGNGLGNFFLLFAGILIARSLGKDVYGAYGLSKAIMFQVAVFSTFGLGYTSTKFISQSLSTNPNNVKSIGYTVILISLLFSAFVSSIILVFSKQFADFSRHEELENVFHTISFLIVFRSLSTVGAGVLSGLKRFKELGFSNIGSGLLMLVISYPFSFYWGLKGALFALSVSQVVLAISNITLSIRYLNELSNQVKSNHVHQLLSFSFPVALQEFSYTIFVWGSNLLMARYASLGELGIYSACSQWNAVVLMVPNLLYNVVLSYLSGTTTIEEQHLMLKKLIGINFFCALIPFVIVFVFSPVISRLYGSEFCGMTSVLNILLFSTIFYSCTNVFYSFLLSLGRNWSLCMAKFLRDIIMIVSLYFILSNTNGLNAARNYAILNVIVAALFLTVLSVISFMLEDKRLTK